MIGTKALNAAMATLLGADTATLAEATPFVEVKLIKAAFSPSPDRVVADLTFADFTGSAAKHAASAATQVFTDPATGDKVIQVNEPAGGWHWQASDAVNLPQTIYGFALLDSGGANLWGCQLLDTPVELLATGDGVDVGSVNFRLPPGALN